jgi:hypothetical protein
VGKLPASIYSCPLAATTIRAFYVKDLNKIKTKRKIAYAQKQKFGSPSLQASLRCQTLAFWLAQRSSLVNSNLISLFIRCIFFDITLL